MILSAFCIAAAPIYEEAGMVQLSPTASNPDFNAQGEYMFSVFGKSADEYEFVVKYLLKKYMNADILYNPLDFDEEFFMSFKETSYIMVQNASLQMV